MQLKSNLICLIFFSSKQDLTEDDGTDHGFTNLLL